MNREALLRAIEGVGTGAGSAEALTEDELFQGLYPVASQARAFNLDKILVIGGRGTGKTQMFRALLSRPGREAVVKATGVKLIHDIHKMISVEGFSAGSSSSNELPKHPAADAIEAVLAEKDIGGARRLWLGLSLARAALTPEAIALLPADFQTLLVPPRERAESARDLCAWVDEDVERPFRILDALDRAAARAGQACVITFDALDRAANDWDRLALVVGGLLSLSLDVMRRCRAVRFKVFLRPDLESDAAKSFPDASKLRGYREEIVWDRGDLYRLAFKRMVAHRRHGEGMRRFLENVLGNGYFERIEPLGWTPTAKLDEGAQARLMVHLAGKYMGKNPQKGSTYTWVPNHLADALRRVSPRSFLVALHTAAEWMIPKPAPSPGPLLVPVSLEEGVKEASKQRVEELAEDFPWVREVARRLEGLLVPCQSKDVVVRLRQCELRGTQKGLRSPDPRSILDQLVELGVFLKDADGRYNVPDLYRVAMNMKRKGGIRLAK